ncbi:NRAMP family divalent metal transporter [Haloarchaeobius iranensis]|uniref:Manganese transport protein n=1 Tax=Haloarchaeobius iranensis TaxID=996166 RepID=A0A1G9XNW1_9EURY|nr:divalent metal cation transporter [Haloarchaeobius iranensis]SDM98522.1 manganese transport protein [Haloarchaeobius iranensis]
MELGARIRSMGPTWLAGAIAAGPATMASLLGAGAGHGYELLWVVLLSAVLGATAQYLAARLGVLTGEGLVSTVEANLGNRWAWLLVVDVVVAAGLAQLVIMKTVADVTELATGIDATIWGVVWAVVLAAGLVGGGYRAAELAAKVVVSLVVLAFVGSLAVVPVDLGAAAGGTVPSLPTADTALVAAGILGGAVHVTLVTMQSYTMRERGWTSEDWDLARFDVVASMGVAFGVYSLAIFLVAASVFHQGPVPLADLTTTTAATALGPAVGGLAESLFLAGLLGAAVSTLGGNTTVPPYALADKLGWDRDGTRYRAAVAVTALAAALGPALGGNVLELLVLVLAFGLVGTPFAIALVLYLLHDPGTVAERPPVLASVGGVVLLAVTAVTAGSWVRSTLSPYASEPLGLLGDPGTLLAGVFAVVLSLATLALGARFVHERATARTRASDA